MDVPPLDKGGLEGGLKEPRPVRRSNTAVSSKKMWVCTFWPESSFNQPAV